MDGPWVTPYELDQDGNPVLDGDDNPIVDQDKLNRYQYNGKELTSDLGLNWNDYGARWYDPAIARWNAVDPLAEEYPSLSPFVYTNNNPIKYIDPNGMYFTKRSQRYLNQLYKEMNRNIKSFNRRIANAEDKGKTDKVDKLTAQRDQLLNSYQDIHQEIGELARSDQGYDIFVSSKYSDSSTDRGGASFNFATGVFEIVLPKSNDIGFIAHELKHAYQFEKGQYSVGPRLSRNEAPHRNLLYDTSDEVSAYNRGGVFGQKTYQSHNLPEEYKDVSTAPVDATTHPTIRHNVNNESILRTIARGTGHAFRINGKTYYNKRK